MRRCIHPTHAALKCLAIAVTVTLIRALPVAAMPAEQAEPVSDCIVNLRTAVSPPVILLGEDTLVTLHAKALCPTIQPLHLVFVLGEPGAMQGDPINQLSGAVKAMIRSLKLADNPSTQVGIVAFQSSARTLCKLMNDEGRLLSCAGKLAAHGGTAIDRGIIQGLKDLADGRRGLDPNVEPNEVMIVVTNSMNGAGCDPVKSAARRAKGQGVLVVTVGIGANVDMQCLKECASSSRYAFDLIDPTQIPSVFDKLIATLPETALLRLTVRETIATGMAYVDDSAIPGADVSGDRMTLEWAVRGVPREGVTLSYRIRPLAAGHHAVSLGASAEFIDLSYRVGHAAFPIPRISVFGWADGKPQSGGSPARDEAEAQYAVRRRADSLPISQ